MEFLLEKIGIINMKYEKLEENDQFNIFPILRKLHDEVHLHSQFIFELLNPNGSHNKGTIFLESFLEEIKIDSFELEEIEVEKELYNIDILINNKHQAIIVENKIRAKDQDKQIERYYNLIKEQGFREIKIVYLKPFEENPSKESLGDLPSEVIEKELIVISYHKEILNWIEKCISISTRHPALRETLIQYSNVVKEITNQGMSEDKEKEVIELLSKNNENIMKAHTIVEHWKRVQWEVEWNFWKEWEEKIISNKHTILENQKFDAEYLRKIIWGKRNRDFEYGLMFEIEKIKSDRICLFLERGNHSIYYGITVLNKKGQRTEKKHAEYYELRKQLDVANDDDNAPLWLSWDYIKPEIDFEYFAEAHTLQLINKEYRTKIIAKNWKDIKYYIQQAQAIILEYKTHV